MAEIEGLELNTMIEVIDLNTMTIEQLMALKADVEAAIKKARADRIKVARKEIQTIIDEHGIPLGELLGTCKGKSGNSQRKPHKPGVPKYRNPRNPAQTWTGKGARPAWFLTAQGSGMTPEDMLIDAPPPPSFPERPE